MIFISINQIVTELVTKKQHSAFLRIGRNLVPLHYMLPRLVVLLLTKHHCKLAVWMADFSMMSSGSYLTMDKTK
jgi:hypothetical protein